MSPTTQTPTKPEPAEHRADPLLQQQEEAIGAAGPKDYHPATAVPVFVIEDSFFRARSPRSMHWSVAWSDLMMTMFVLFLTLFVYQLAHREFLSEEEVEVVAGSDIALPPPETRTGFPFAPIYPVVSDRDADTLKSIEEVTVTEEEVDALLERRDLPINELEIIEETIAQPEPIADSVAVELPGPPAEATEAAPEAVASPVEGRPEVFTEIYDLSRVALESEKLERFASVELIPDKAMRIILTGDLLFDTGQADLTASARSSLGKLAGIIKKTPYIINVVGHTDSVPMHSTVFPSNWELSTARASRVARYLIEQAGIPPAQIVVSGFSHFRPVRPNSNATNRSANRRVEIILSKELPPTVSLQTDPLN